MNACSWVGWLAGPTGSAAILFTAWFLTHAIGAVTVAPGPGGNLGEWMEKPGRSDPTIHRFGDCELDEGRFELRRGGVPRHLEPQVFEVLAYLVRNRGRLVTKAELLDEVWGSRFVSESALTSRVKAAAGRSATAAASSG
jgi:DNA-binding response OmpR family regulator